MRSSNWGVWCWVHYLCLVVFANSAMAEDAVYFADAHLKAAVESRLNISNPTPSDMLQLTELDVLSKGITDLTGLEHALNLTMLDASGNNITDISPLSALTKITYLELQLNHITDLSPVTGLTKLGYINFEHNSVTDLSPLSGISSLTRLYADGNGIENISMLSGLYNLRELEVDINKIQDISVLAKLYSLVWLDLDHNKIRDISPLKNLRNLIRLDLTYNPLNEEACTKYLPTIIKNNPGIDIKYDACSGVNQFTLTISSSEGGSVTKPGEGNQGPYTSSTLIVVEATPEEGYSFSEWTGSAADAGKVIKVNSMSTAVIVDSTYTITANFVADSPVEEVTFYVVDDNAPADPLPGDLSQSDVLEDGSALHPFDSIQEAIDLAADGFVIQVQPGTYFENLDFQGKALEVRGMEPNDPNTGDVPLLYGLGTAPTVRLTETVSGQSPVLKGMAVVGSKRAQTGAIECVACSPTLINCLVTGNYTSQMTGAAILAVDCNLMMMNCTIAHNTGGTLGAGIVLQNSQMLLLDSIVWGNSPKGILADANSVVVSQFCDLQEQGVGQGNLIADPLFVESGNWVHPDIPSLILTGAFSISVWLPGDYHLKSQEGHWDTQTQAFVADSVTSPCIDAGSDLTYVGLETDPNGHRLNQGVFGGTIFASRTYTETEPYSFVIKDENLKTAIQDWINIWWEPTEEDLRWVTSLDLRYEEIVDLTGLEAAKNLQYLNVRGNHISDISPLQSLAQLSVLNLSENQLHDISGVATMTQLRNLDVHGNGVTDLTPLSGLTQLTSLTIRENNFGGNLSALSGLTNLEYLHLQGNQVLYLSDLRRLTKLKQLYLNENWISDISILANMTQLETLDLRYNRLTSISALTNLTHLKKLFLEYNSLGTQAHLDLQTIKNNNPDIDIDIN